MLVASACAPKRDYTASTVPGWDFVQSIDLESPEALSPGQQRDFADGWRDLQQGSLEAAASELRSLSRRHGRSVEIATANGFLELRLGDLPGAERYFQVALSERSTYGPAQSGYFLAALSAGNDELAYDRLGALEKDFPQHPLVERYGTTLKVNVAESRLARARELAREGHFDEAADVYLTALALAPEVGALYLEAAEAELAAGLTDRAALHAEQATELESENTNAFRVLGEARYAGGELDAAYAAYRRAAELSPGDAEIEARLGAIELEYEAANLPPEYLGIRDAERVNRAQLAALVYLELRDAFDGAPSGASVIATDIGDSWASTYIRRVTGVGILEVYSNHMFQPAGFVRRYDLADALSRALERLSPESYRAARESSRFEQRFSDLAPGNPQYEAAALAVSLGLIFAREGAFDPQGFVSGSEAATAVDTLAAHMAP